MLDGRLFDRDGGELNVLAIEPYYGGSHKAFLEALISASRHRWALATLPARHWKWRMRSAPAEILGRVAAAVGQWGRPDVVLVSDMLDLPTFLGLSTRDRRFKHWICNVPVVTYFHENQWAYPTPPETPADHHYGYTNLLTAAASDACWFNSEFNHRTFLELSRAFVDRMPDSRRAIDLDRIAERCRVIAPGFSPPSVSKFARSGTTEPIRLGWVSRFEHDKRPDLFLRLLKRLRAEGLEFELILLGERGRNCETREEIYQRFETVIRFDGFVESRAEYENKLSQIDLVLSTAEHEFFGIALCEAIWAGAVPVTPDGLAYPEYIPEPLRYESLDEAVRVVMRLSHSPAERKTLAQACRRRIAKYQIERVVKTFDVELEYLVAAGMQNKPPG